MTRCSPPSPSPYRTYGLRFCSLLLLSLLAACAHVPEHNPLAVWTPSPNHDQRHPYLIVIHFTEEGSLQQALDTLRTHNPGGPVSAHYLIAKSGVRYQLVADEDRAWQAGKGSWGSISDVNSASIGIELDNNGHEPFSKDQIDSLILLLNDLCKRLHIPRTNVIGHQDIAPTRKPDPGALFPWSQLAQAGLGLWPDANTPAPDQSFDPWLALRAIGYPVTDRPSTVKAFHNHYRGIGGDQLDAEDLKILSSLAYKLKNSAIPAPVLTLP